MNNREDFEKWMEKHFPTFNLNKRKDGWYNGREAFLMYQAYQEGCQVGKDQLLEKIIKEAQNEL